MLIDLLFHRLTSKTRHGVHSPFVYELVDQCIYGKTYREIAVVEKHFEQLKGSTETVKGIDHGREKQFVKKTVGQMARHVSVRNFEARLLHRLVFHHKPQHILELGTNIGKSAAYMAAANPDARLITVEGNAGLFAMAAKNFNALVLNNILCVHSEFSEYLRSSDGERFDMAFIDGNHRFAPTLEYYHILKHRMREGGCIIFHDIYWSSGMRRAWREIRKDPDATVVIDLYFFGLVYFRKGQAREQFKIRFPKSLFVFLGAILE